MSDIIKQVCFLNAFVLTNIFVQKFCIILYADFNLFSSLIIVLWYIRPHDKVSTKKLLKRLG